MGVLLTSDTDWDEIRELVTETYGSSRPRSSLHSSTRSVGVLDVPHPPSGWATSAEPD